MYSYTSPHTEIQTHICYKHHNLKTMTWRELPLVWGYFSVWTTLVLETFDASLNVQIWEPTLISHISFVQTLFKAEALHLFVSSVRTSVFLHSVMFWKRIECYLHTFVSPTPNAYCVKKERATWPCCETGKGDPARPISQTPSCEKGLCPHDSVTSLDEPGWAYYRPRKLLLYLWPKASNLSSLGSFRDPFFGASDLSSMGSFWSPFGGVSIF